MKNTDTIKKIIYDNIDPVAMQSPDATKDEIFDTIIKGLEANLSFALTKNDVVMVFVPEGVALLKMHFFSNNKGFSIVDANLHMCNYVFRNSNYQKIYGVTANKKMVKYAIRARWKHEGTLTKSFLDANGNLVDQYILGLTREDSLRE